MLHGRPQGRARGGSCPPWPAKNSMFLYFLGKIVSFFCWFLGQKVGSCPPPPGKFLPSPGKKVCGRPRHVGNSTNFTYRRRVTFYFNENFISGFNLPCTIILHVFCNRKKPSWKLRNLQRDCYIFTPYLCRARKKYFDLIVRNPLRGYSNNTWHSGVGVGVRHSVKDTSFTVWKAGRF